MTQLMTVEELEQYLRFTKRTLYRLLKRGSIPAIKIGNKWRFDKAAIDRWLHHNMEGARARILVVDDDVGVRETLRDIISEAGHRVIAVESGERALEEIERQNFDLVFLDLVLPGLSGLELFQEIRQKDDRTVVVIVTGYGDEPIASQAMSLGPLLLIRKPCSIDDINKVLNMVVKARP